MGTQVDRKQTQLALYPASLRERGSKDIRQIWCAANNQPNWKCRRGACWEHAASRAVMKTLVPTHSNLISVLNSRINVVSSLGRPIVIAYLYS